MDNKVLTTLINFICSYIYSFFYTNKDKFATDKLDNIANDN